MLRSRFALLTAAGALLVAAAPAQAKPHVSGSSTMPKGLGSGGQLVAGPDHAMWMTTGASEDGPVKAALLRISAAGKLTRVKVPVPTGIQFLGLGVGADGKLWFSGIANGGDHRGYSGRVVGHGVQMKEEPNSQSWSAIAVVGGVAYVGDGFEGLETSTDGETFTPLVSDGVAAWDLVASGGELFFAGDGAVGTFTPGQSAGTAFTSPIADVPLDSRSLAVTSGGTAWWVQSSDSGVIHKLGRATAAGVVTFSTLPALPLSVVTGPDGNPWALTQHSLLKIAADGSVAAKLSLPSGQTAVALGSGLGKLWVSTFSNSADRVLRIAP